MNTNIASTGSNGAPIGVSMGIGIGAGSIVTLSLGLLLFFMEKRTKKQRNEPKETPRQWYQFDEMNKPPSSERDPDITPKATEDAIPALVIEE